MRKDTKEILEELDVPNTSRAIEKLKIEVDDEGYYLTTDGSKFFNDEEAIVHEYTGQKIVATRTTQEVAAAEALENQGINISFYTTSNTNTPIKENLGEVFAYATIGTGEVSEYYFYEFYYDDLRNIFGERIDSIDRTIRVARRTALIELQQKTKARGGNAVVNLNFLLSPGGRVNLMAYGDAVILDKSKEE